MLLAEPAFSAYRRRRAVAFRGSFGSPEYTERVSKYLCVFKIIFYSSFPLFSIVQKSFSQSTICLYAKATALRAVRWFSQHSDGHRCSLEVFRNPPAIPETVFLPGNFYNSNSHRIRIFEHCSLSRAQLLKSCDFPNQRSRLAFESSLRPVLGTLEQPDSLPELRLTFLLVPNKNPK